MSQTTEYAMQNSDHFSKRFSSTARSSFSMPRALEEELRHLALAGLRERVGSEAQAHELIELPGLLAVGGRDDHLPDGLVEPLDRGAPAPALEGGPDGLVVIGIERVGRLLAGTGRSRT